MAAMVVRLRTVGLLVVLGVVGGRGLGAGPEGPAADGLGDVGEAEGGDGKGGRGEGYGGGLDGHGGGVAVGEEAVHGQSPSGPPRVASISCRTVRAAWVSRSPSLRLRW